MNEMKVYYVKKYFSVAAAVKTDQEYEQNVPDEPSNRHSDEAVSGYNNIFIIRGHNLLCNYPVHEYTNQNKKISLT